MSVFGREGPHPYEDALSTLLASDNPPERAIGRNLMHDWRVTKAREDILETIGEGPRTAPELERAVRKYFKVRVRTAPDPDYVDIDLNEENVITGKPTIQTTIPDDVELARLLDLNGLAGVFRWAKGSRDEWREVFSGVPSPEQEDRVDDWLSDRLLHSSPGERLDFVSVVLDVLAEQRKRCSFQPAWATTWAALEPFVPQGAARWAQVLGLGSWTAPRWVALLVYTAGEAGMLVRPSQLDAEWYSYHFPSPREAALTDGGHPMDLRVTPRAAIPLPEFIHLEIDHRKTHIVAIDRISADDETSLTEQRISHHGLLKERYGDDTVIRWMPEPI